MSRLAEYRKLEQQLAAQLAELESMKGDLALQAEMAPREHHGGLHVADTAGDRDYPSPFSASGYVLIDARADGLL